MTDRASDRGARVTRLLGGGRRQLRPRCRERIAGLIRRSTGGASLSTSSTLRPSARISLTSTLKLSGMPASKVSSPRTIAS